MSKVQLQIAEISGGGQIPLDQVQGGGGGPSVLSLNGELGHIVLSSADVSIVVQTPAPGVINLTTPAVAAAAGAQATANGAVVTATAALNDAATAQTTADVVTAKVAVNPATDNASQYTLPAATLTANRSVTLGTGGAPATGTLVNIVRRDSSVRTYAVINGGVGGGTLFTFAGSPATAQAASFYFDGTNWVLVGFQYVSVA
jgi:hypothetical protein